MKAVWIREFGDVGNLEIREVDKPVIAAEDNVLVRVAAAGLNRPDVLQIKGRYPAPPGYPQEIPGLEFAGEVAEVGGGVTKFRVGDRVFGITGGGALAEYLTTKESLLVKIPDNLSFVEAGAIPEVFITAHDALFTQAGLIPGETLLIHAVGSGVGLAALQLAKAHNVKVLGTSRTADKLEACKEFGLDETLLIESGTDLVALVKEKTGGKRADVILDLVGAKYFPANLQSLALKGRLMIVGLLGGATTDFDMSAILQKRAKIIGTLLRPRTHEEKAEATAAFAEQVLPLLESGAVKANIDEAFSFEDVTEAYCYLESNASFGKVVLEF